MGIMISNITISYSHCSPKIPKKNFLTGLRRPRPSEKKVDNEALSAHSNFKYGNRFLILRSKNINKEIFDSNLRKLKYLKVQSILIV